MTDQQFETMLQVLFGVGIGWCGGQILFILALIGWHKWSDWRDARQWKAYEEWINNGRKGPMP